MRDNCIVTERKCIVIVCLDKFKVCKNVCNFGAPEKCCAVWVQAGKIYNNKLSPSRDKNPLLVISRISQTCYSRILAVNFISRNELLKKSAEGSAKSREESRFVELMQCVNGNAWAVRRPTVDV